jgi:hypothetical protein
MAPRKGSLQMSVIEGHLEATPPAAKSWKGRFRTVSDLTSHADPDMPTLWRPDVLATMLMVPVALGLSFWWGLTPNWQIHRFITLKVMVVTLIAVPTYVLFRFVSWLVGRKKQNVSINGFFGNMILLTIMSWVYTHIKAGVLLGANYDQLLHRIDLMLFVGHEPWTLFRSLVPHSAAHFIHVIYMLFFPVLVASLFWLTLGNRKELAGRMTCALMIGYYVGALMYHVLPSYGPAYIFADASPQVLAPATYQVQQSLLRQVEAYQSVIQSSAVAPWKSIGAFPSLHVSHVLILCWYMRYSRVALFFSSVFAMISVFATVYLGWHYVCDWFGGFAIAALAIWITSHWVSRAKCVA